MEAGEPQSGHAAVASLSISRLIRAHRKDVLASFMQRVGADSNLSDEQRQNPALFDFSARAVDAWADIFEAAGDGADGGRVGRLAAEKVREVFPPASIDALTLTRELMHFDSAIAEFAHKWMGTHPAVNKLQDAVHELLTWSMTELTRRAEQRGQLPVPGRSLVGAGTDSFNHFEMLARTASDALYDWELQNDEIIWSEGLTTLFGYTTADQRRNLSWWTEALHPEDRTRVLESLQRARELGNRAWTEEYRFRRKDGTWAHVVDRGYFLHDERGRATHMFGAILDVTRTKRAEQERLRMYEEAQQDVRARDDLLSLASHELRNPLCTLRLQLEDLRRRLEALPAGTTEGLVLSKLEKALHQEVRLERLISELFDVSRISYQGMELTAEPVDLTEVVRRCVAEIEEESRRLGSPIQVRAPGPVMGAWNRAHVEQIVRNLLGNAVKYGAGKPVEVTVGQQTAEAVLTIKDSGIGIAPADQERIFERFERAVSQRHYGGLGLGLWIVRSYVDAMGGSIRVDSQPGSGSMFRVQLPLGPVHPS